MAGQPVAAADRARSFPPILGPAPRLLILGSLPGRASLAAGEYYAHPRNLFWDLLGELVGAGRDLPYAQRTALLRERGIALWDVIAEARRPGSLDASIDFAGARHNDIAALIGREPTLRAVAFNGAAARMQFQRQVAPRPVAGGPPLDLLPLPSTSPAHAGMRRAAKLAAWRPILAYCGA
jgi:TDG/mug DNA glycosylase family protein